MVDRLADGGARSDGGKLAAEAGDREVQFDEPFFYPFSLCGLCHVLKSQRLTVNER